MSRVFAYCRVSTTDQTAENKLQEIASAAFARGPQAVVEETISGSVVASGRPSLGKLADKLEDGDVLVVTKLDRA